MATPPSELAPWWSKPEWITGIGTVALVVVTAALVVVPLATWLIDRYLKRRERFLRICRADRFDPEEIVGAPRARGFSEYLPTSQDDVIWPALHDGESIGLRGRPGIGKSHSAAFYIKNLGLSSRGSRRPVWWCLGKLLSRCHVPGFQDYSEWYVIRPLPQELQNANTVRVRKRRYILLLDDLNDYVRNDDATAVLDLIGALRRQSKRLIVFSTLRNTAPEALSVNAISKIFGRWKWIDLPDWNYDQGERLAQKCGGRMDQWDGTPLSVKQPSSEMRAKYDLLALDKHAAASILRCLLFFREHGLSSVPRSLLKGACATRIFNVELAEFESSLAIINRFGFLKIGTQFIEAYGPYLETIEDWVADTDDNYQVIRDLMIKERRVPELMAMAWDWSAKEKYSEAEWICRKCVELFPRNVSAHISLGFVLGKQQDFKGAESAVKSALALYPGNLRAQSLLAGIWTKIGRLDDAERAYRQVLVLAPYMFEANVGLGILLLEKGDGGGAEQAFREALRIRPESARAMGFLADSLRRLKRDEEAEQCYKTAIEVDSKMLELRAGYALLLCDKPDYVAAVKESRQAIALKPNSALAHSALGKSLQGLGNLNEAENALRIAASLDSRNVDFKMNLGIVLAEEGKHEEARDLFAKVVELEPDFARGYSYLAEEWAKLGNREEAERCYATASKIDPQMQEAFTGLGMTLLKDRDYLGAEKAFTHALEIGPGSPWIYARLADSLRRQGKLDEAEEMNRKGICSDPEVLRLRKRHGDWCLLHGELERAEGSFRDVLSLDPDNLEACSRLAETLIRLGKEGELQSVLEKLVQIDPQDPIFYVGPGMAALKSENWIQAEKLFRKAIELDSDHARAHQHLGDALLHLNRIDQAVKALRDAIKINPKMSKAHYLLGKALLKKGFLGPAEDALRESVRINDNFAESHLLLAETLEQLGHCNQAAVEYERALALQRSLAEAKDRLVVLASESGRKA